jgi:signal transduction histidine kinase
LPIRLDGIVEKNGIYMDVSKLLIKIKSEVVETNWSQNMHHMEELSGFNEKILDNIHPVKIKQKIPQRSFLDNIFEIIVNQLPCGIVALDSEDKVIFINHLTEDYFNLNKNNYIGVSFTLFDQSLSKASSNDVNDNSSHKKPNFIISSASESSKCDAVKFDKNTKIFLRDDVIINDNELLSRIVVYSEITDEYEYLRNERETLSIISHQLRTPLANVLGYSDLLMHVKNNETEVNEYIGIINREAKLIAKFLDNNALYGKLGSQHYDQHNFVDISINSLVKAALEQISTPIGRDVVELNSLNQDINVKTDPQIFFLAFSNVVSNAYKYSKSKVSVDINVENGMLVVAIIDEGVGIAPNELNTIFNKFWRSKTVSRNSDGTGLGMSIVKDALDLIGLDIDIVSVLNEGTKVNIKFALG